MILSTNNKPADIAIKYDEPIPTLKFNEIQLCYQVVNMKKHAIFINDSTKTVFHTKQKNKQDRIFMKSRDNKKTVWSETVNVIHAFINEVSVKNFLNVMDQPQITIKVHERWAKLKVKCVTIY